MKQILSKYFRRFVEYFIVLIVKMTIISITVPKPVFQGISRKSQQYNRDPDVISKEHEELIKYIRDCKCFHLLFIKIDIEYRLVFKCFGLITAWSDVCHQYHRCYSTNKSKYTFLHLS